MDVSPTRDLSNVSPQVLTLPQKVEVGRGCKDCISSSSALLAPRAALEQTAYTSFAPRADCLHFLSAYPRSGGNEEDLRVGPWPLGCSRSFPALAAGCFYFYDPSGWKFGPSPAYSGFGHGTVQRTPRGEHTGEATLGVAFQGGLR
ncbi:hypothetical protein LIER_43733 [Lithospermum erythrorhizon]|uniref:Uncharacterized protein n=1 Tax=Lithospermum erythrorhizon TaxID=34254 RepID=A0AAV3QP86_LITER